MTQPPAFAGKLNLDAAVPEAKLNRLRKSTKLDYVDSLVVSRPGRKAKAIRLKESWTVVFGRITADGKSRFGAVRARALLCSATGAEFVIKEPDTPQTPK